MGSIIAIHPSNDTIDHVRVAENIDERSLFCVSRKYGLFCIANNGQEVRRYSKFNQLQSTLILKAQSSIAERFVGIVFDEVYDRLYVFAKVESCIYETSTMWRTRITVMQPIIPNSNSQQHDRNHTKVSMVEMKQETPSKKIGHEESIEDEKEDPVWQQVYDWHCPHGAYTLDIIGTIKSFQIELDSPPLEWDSD